jgi:Mce-associated membrane protein
VDLAVVRADGVTEPDSTTDNSGIPSISLRPGGLPLLLVTAAVLVALVVAAVLLGIREHHRRQAATTPSSAATVQAQQAALAAARGEAVALTTLNYRTASAGLDRILAGATGALRTQFEKEKSQLPATLAQTKSLSRGTVLSSALSSLSGTHAQALVAADATVSGSDTGPSGVLKHYRMVVSLQQVNGTWLADDVAFAGTPQ